MDARYSQNGPRDIEYGLPRSTKCMFDNQYQTFYYHNSNYDNTVHLLLPANILKRISAKDMSIVCADAQTSGKGLDVSQDIIDNPYSLCYYSTTFETRSFQLIYAFEPSTSLAGRLARDNRKYFYSKLSTNHSLT
jgi:hypothetical protein